MIKVGDRVLYWYRMDRPGTVTGFVSAPENAVWIEGGSPAIPVRVVVKFDNGEELTYQVSDLRLVE